MAGSIQCPRPGGPGVAEPGDGNRIHPWSAPRLAAATLVTVPGRGRLNGWFLIPHGGILFRAEGSRVAAGDRQRGYQKGGGGPGDQDQQGQGRGEQVRGRVQRRLLAGGLQQGEPAAPAAQGEGSRPPMAGRKINPATAAIPPAVCRMIAPGPRPIMATTNSRMPSASTAPGTPGGTAIRRGGDRTGRPGRGRRT